MHAVHGCDVAGKLSSCCRRRVVRCSCTSANPCTMANAMEHFQPNPRTRGNASRRCDAKAKSRLSQDSCVLRDSATMRHARCVKTQRCCACSKDLSQNGYRKLPIGIAYCCCLLLLPIAASARCKSFTNPAHVLQMISRPLDEARWRNLRQQDASPSHILHMSYK